MAFAGLPISPKHNNWLSMSLKKSSKSLILAFKSDSSSSLGHGKRSRNPSSHNDFDSHKGDESEGEDDEISACEDDADEETTSRSASKKAKGESTLNDRIEITIYPMSVNSTTRNLQKKKNNKVKNFKGISHDDLE